jgi:hypothetical protein
MSAHEHPDFANVIRVARFHQAPQRIQYLSHQPANVIVLPVIATKGRSPSFLRGRARDLVERARHRPPHE